MFFRNRFFVLCKPLDDDGDDNGGSNTGVIDRGDSLEPPKVDEPKVTDKEVEDEAKKLLKDEEEPKDEPKDEPARDATGKFAKKDHDDARIPKARFDEAMSKERAAREAAEARAAALEAQVKQASKSEEVQKREDEIEALEAKHSKLILDGEHEAAAKVMKEIRLAERQIANMENEVKLTKATTQAVEQVRMEAAIARLESDHPALNQESEEYDQDLVDLVLAEQRRLMTEQGYTAARALTTAGDKIMRKFGAAQAAPKDAEPKKGLDAAKDSSRKADQVAKNLDTEKRQPPNQSVAGKDSDKAGMKDTLTDVTKLTPEEFAALPAATKAKLRGDFA